MNKVILKILAIISILIIVFGVFGALNITKELQRDSGENERIYMDGSDVTPFVDLIQTLGSMLLGAIVISYTVLIVLGIWGIYGIVFLIIMIINKCKKKRQEGSENIIKSE